MDDRVNMDEFHGQEVGEMKGTAKKKEEGLLNEIESLKEYAAYVKQRYDEVLENNDVVHDVEVMKLHQDGKEVEAGLRTHLTASK